MPYDSTKLWKRTLGLETTDPVETKALEALRTAYGALRERIRPIVSQAHHDCYGLTIHDLTHLDALWEMSDLIVDDGFPVNPIEGFVLGCAFLLHDAALSCSAYEGGLAKIKESTEYLKNIGSLSGIAGGKAQSPSEQEARERTALFMTLRDLHAKQCEELLEREWITPDRVSIRLIDDEELRSFYGQSIGRIAHSHHWDIEQVDQELEQNKGALPGFPSGWYLNEIKIASILRCADAIHIDRRRAPTMEYSLVRPQGVSRNHWSFQHKLGVPAVRERRLVYTSSRDFGKGEAEAWWLCFDTCRMISREIEAASAVLRDRFSLELAVEGVEGVTRPPSFAKLVRTDGWVPVDAEVKVSDPLHLARTLGGANLYGKGYIAPIRELLQNSIDALHLRIKKEEARGNLDYKPKVRLSLKRVDRAYRLSIEDNGVGMSDRVLTGGLLDFGKSLWRQQADGIGLNELAISGRFGIGFFSVFLLGDTVTVESRPFDKGIADVLTLEFSGLNGRPIVVPGARAGFSSEMSTRVEVVLGEDVLRHGIEPGTGKARYSISDSYPRRREKTFDMFAYCRWLVAGANAEIQFIDGVGGRSFTHSGVWSVTADERFLEDLLQPNGDDLRRNVLDEDEGEDESEFDDDDDDEEDAPYEFIAGDYAPLLDDIVREDELIGRAAILLQDSDDNVGFLRIGGLTYSLGGNDLLTLSGSYIPPYVGIMAGDVSIATRSGAVPAVTALEIADWASRQAEKGQSANLNMMEKIRLAQEVYKAGGDPNKLPFAYLGGKLLSLAAFKAALTQIESVCCPVSLPMTNDECEWISIESSGTSFLLEDVRSDICILLPDGEPDVYDRNPFEREPLKIEPREVFTESDIKVIDMIGIKLLFDILGKKIFDCNLSWDIIEIFTIGQGSRRRRPVIRVSW